MVVGLALAAVAFRFVTRSPLWLDEALSVNIARLPLGDIPEALRHDGHPPLYYFLLHGWMELFGNGDVAVRALSGVFGLALFPLMWVAGRRLAGRQGAWAAVLVLAVSPYAIRYSTETRMYSLVMVLGLAAWLVGTDALEPADDGPPGRCWPCSSGALLWTHYWAMWFLAAVGLALLVRGFRARANGRADEVRATVRVIVAIAAGGVLFLPWVPSLAVPVDPHRHAVGAVPSSRPRSSPSPCPTSAAGASGDSVLLGVISCWC